MKHKSLPISPIISIICKFAKSTLKTDSWKIDMFQILLIIPFEVSEE